MIMMDFTLSNCKDLDVRKGTCCITKRFAILLVMMVMITSKALAGASFEVIDGFKYILDSDTKTATLLPNTEKYAGDVVIPESVKAKDGNDYKVTAFGDECFGFGLTSITIPSSVTSLGDYCFWGCSLTSITIPSSVTSLGEYCFSGCDDLTSITIPSSVITLGKSCFAQCYSLTSINIPSSVTAIGDNCFAYCRSLTSVTIPSSVTSLGDECFWGCDSLASITIPSSVTSLGESCFANCSGLTSITIPTSVTSLREDCFNGCNGLTSITIPSSVTSLGEDCFCNCIGLTSITIPSSVTSLWYNCFRNCNNLESLYFKGKTPVFFGRAEMPKTCIIYVPEEYLQNYKDILRPDYKYIYAWNPNGSGDGDKPVTPCATPSVSYESGKLKFSCETAGAKYHYTISDKDMATDALSEDGNVTLSAAYDISVYATADGYKTSEKAKATLYWVNANLENATNINQARTRGVVASAHDGIVSISGLDNGEVVKFYAADGKLVGSSSAVDGTASCAVSETMVIAKFGDNAIKVAVK